MTFPVRKMASRAATSFVYASAGQGRATLVRTMKDMGDFIYFFYFFNCSSAGQGRAAFVRTMKDMGDFSSLLSFRFSFFFSWKFFPLSNDLVFATPLPDAIHNMFFSFL